MEGHLRFFFGQFIFFSSILTLISISIIKKNFLGHTDNLTYGNDTLYRKIGRKNTFDFGGLYMSQRGILGKLVMLRYSLTPTSIFIIKVHFQPNTDILTYNTDINNLTKKFLHLGRGPLK
jgi:hypothetical protein